MPVDSADEASTVVEQPATTNADTVKLPGNNPWKVNSGEIPKAIGMAVAMDKIAGAFGMMMPGGQLAIPLMVLLDLFLIHPLTSRSHHSLDYIEATLPRETATFIRAAVIRDKDDVLRSAVDTARLAAGPDETDLNILNAKAYALLQLEKQALRDPQMGPMHRVLAEVIRYQTEAKIPLDDASLEDARNPLTADGKVSRAQQVAAEAINALRQTREGKRFLWQADRIAGAKILSSELTRALQRQAIGEAAERQSQLAIFNQPDGMRVIMPSTLDAGTDCETESYVLHTMPNGERIGYRVEQDKYVQVPILELYNRLRQETDGRLVPVFKPDPTYAAVGPPREFLPPVTIGVAQKEITGSLAPPAPFNKDSTIAPTANLPAPIPTVTAEIKPVALTVYATPACPFIDNSVGPILRLLASKLAQQNSASKIQVTVIGNDAAAADLRKRVFGDGHYPITVNPEKPTILKKFSIHYSGDFVVENLPNQKPYIGKGWSQQYALDIAQKMGLDPLKFKDDIMHHKDAREAFISLPLKKPIQGCEFMFNQTVQLSNYPPDLSINVNRAVFLNGQSLIRYQLAGRFYDYQTIRNAPGIASNDLWEKPTTADKKSIAKMYG